MWRASHTHTHTHCRPRNKERKRRVQLSKPAHIGPSTVSLGKVFLPTPVSVHPTIINWPSVCVCALTINLVSFIFSHTTTAVNDRILLLLLEFVCCSISQPWIEMQKNGMPINPFSWLIVCDSVLSDCVPLVASKIVCVCLYVHWHWCFTIRQWFLPSGSGGDSLSTLDETNTLVMNFN